MAARPSLRARPLASALANGKPAGGHVGCHGNGSGGARAGSAAMELSLARVDYLQVGAGLRGDRGPAEREAQRRVPVLWAAGAGAEKRLPVGPGPSRPTPSAASGGPGHPSLGTPAG